MTPERLQAIRDEALQGKRMGGHFMPDDVLELLDYIDHACADAWDEGRDAALEAFDPDGYYEGTTNPYRKYTK